MDRFGQQQSYIVKKSPVVIVKTFIVLQMTAVALFFLSAVLLDYGEIFDSLPLPTSLSYHIAEAIGIFILETFLVFYIFFRWYKEYYEIKNDNIIHGRGIIIGRKTVTSLSAINSISYRQGPLGKLTRYGNIELKERSGDKVVMDHIPEPHNYVELLIRLKESTGVKLSENVSLGEIIAEGEHEGTEFKRSFRWDVNQGKVNKSLERAVMKTIVAFLNSRGGRLVIGVDDSGKVSGLQDDYRSLPKSNADGFQNHFNNVFHSAVGPEFRQFVDMKILQAAEGEYCLISVNPSGKPAYLKNDNNEEFFIRTGNGTTSLKLSEASSYIDTHWRAKLL